MNINTKDPIFTNININKIFPNPNQPRKHFDKKKLDELAASIGQHGLMEPLVVVERQGGYMIVAGERRYRASKLAGFKMIPARIIEADDIKLIELAIVENLEREDLNLIEEAQGYQQLMDMGLNLQQVAEKIGKHPWRIQERLNLLKLDTIYQDCLIKNLITPSQAQELSRLDSEGQNFLFEKIKNSQANTYNKLRALANAILYRCGKQEQSTICVEPTIEEKAIKSRYETMIERVSQLISRSFSAEDLQVLRSVLDSNLELNIERLDLIIKNLNQIKKAMIQAGSFKEVLAE